jgi:hypothetical protein
VTQGWFRSLRTHPCPCSSSAKHSPTIWPACSDKLGLDRVPHRVPTLDAYVAAAYRRVEDAKDNGAGAFIAERGSRD